MALAVACHALLHISRSIVGFDGAGFANVVFSKASANLLWTGRVFSELW